MIGRRFVVILVVLLSGFAPVAWAATLPASVRQSSSAAVITAPINTFLAGQITALTGTNPTAQSAAKDAIIAEALSSGTDKPSGIFLAVYATALDAALKPAVASKDVRVRLNAAVVAGRVAEKANSAGLVPTVLALLKDENQAVALMAVKAAKPLIPPVLNAAASVPAPAARAGGAAGAANAAGPQIPLIQALVAATTKFADFGPLVQSAYEALQIEQAATNVPRANWNFAVPAVVKAIQEIMAARLELYKSGVPDMPQVDPKVGNFLILTQGVWSAAPAQQVQTIQLLSNLISLAGQRVALTPDRTKKEDLIGVIKQAGGYLVVLGGREKPKYPGLDAAAKPVSDLGPASAEQQVTAATSGLFEDLKKIPSLSSLQPPPTISSETAAKP
jgi:hypothetical protein